MRTGTKIVSLALLGALAIGSVVSLKQAEAVGLAEWVKAHPDASVEYVYPGIQIAANGSAPMAGAAASVTKLPGGTPVQIKILESIDSEQDVEGASIKFKVISPVKVGGKTLITANTLGSATITTLEEKGRIGRAGKLIISDFSTKAVDGSYVPLSATLSEKAKDKTTLSAILSIVLCPLFLLMKGEEAVIPAGTEKTIYTSADVDVAI